MANCVYSDVRLIIDTDLEDTEITTLIDLADAEITGRGMNTRSSSLRKVISMLLTASLIAGRDPKSRGIGEYSDTLMTPKDWRDLAESTVKKTGSIPFFVANEPMPWE